MMAWLKSIQGNSSKDTVIICDYGFDNGFVSLLIVLVNFLEQKPILPYLSFVNLIDLNIINYINYINRTQNIYIYLKIEIQRF